MQPAVLGDSAILSQVETGTRDTFIRELREWLPAITRTLLLYRGSVDGMTAVDFHRCCDGKGATLTLIRSKCGHTFGGYSDVSWSSPTLPVGERQHSSTAFLFSVVNSHADGVAQFPLKPDKGANLKVVLSSLSIGPCFGVGGDILLQNDDCAHAGPFGKLCAARICGETYTDTLGKGRTTFTGAADGMFIPAEVEVYTVV